MTITSGIDATNGLPQSSVDETGNSNEDVVVKEVDLEEVALAVFANQDRARRMKGKKRSGDFSETSSEGKPNPNPKGSNADGDGFLQKRCYNEYPRRKILLLDSKNS